MLYWHLFRNIKIFYCSLNVWFYLFKGRCFLKNRKKDKNIEIDKK